MNINQLGGQPTNIGTFAFPAQWRPITIPKKGERVVEQDSKMHGIVVDIDRSLSVGDQIVMKGDDHEIYKHHTSHYMKEDEYNAAHPGEQKSISSLSKYMIIHKGQIYILKKGKTKVSSDSDYEGVILEKMYLVEIIESWYAPAGLMFKIKFLYGEYKDRFTIENRSDDFIKFKYLNLKLKSGTVSSDIKDFIILLGDITHEINRKNFDINEYNDIYDTLKQNLARGLLPL
jgi:hypothetical protein